MWKLPASERIAHWKAFRKTLDTLPVDQALQSVSDFWHSCPFCPFYLDPDRPDAWPTPWELIAENYYCDLARAAGMLYTIYFTQHGSNLQSEIHVYNDRDTQHTYNLVVLDQGKYVLNFQDGKVVNTVSINKNLAHVKTYSSTDLKLQEY
jgi:hypothetical protein